MNEEEIKNNCVFCKIIKEEIPSYKVFEDDKVLAILDINPASKGHLLVMPKEHYPVLPLVPPGIIDHLFLVSKRLITAVKNSMISQNAFLFIANGAAAGQQSPHFLFHIFPEEDSKFEFFDNQYAVDQKELEVLKPLVKSLIQKIYQGLNISIKKEEDKEIEKNKESNNELKKDLINKEIIASNNKNNNQERNNIELNKKEFEEEVKKDKDDFEFDNKKALMLFLTNNPDFKKLVMTNPELVKEYAKKSPEINKLFEGIDIEALSIKLREQAGIKKIIKHDGVPESHELSDKELFDFINKKEKLKELLINNIDELKELIKNNERLKIFFNKETPEEVKSRFLKFKEYLNKNDKEKDLSLEDSIGG